MIAHTVEQVLFSENLLYELGPSYIHIYDINIMDTGITHIYKYRDT